MNGFLPPLLAALWCLAHLGAYFAGLRNLRPLRGERGILLFHAVPVALACLLLVPWLAVAPAEGARWAGAIAAIALLGIYAMSFLELWSLSEGSYSLSILAAVAASGRAEGAQLRELARIGARKQQARTESLLRLGLARPDVQGRLAATGAGRLVAGASAVLLWLAAIDRSG